MKSIICNVCNGNKRVMGVKTLTLEPDQPCLVNCEECNGTGFSVPIEYIFEMGGFSNVYRVR